MNQNNINIYNKTNYIINNKYKKYKIHYKKINIIWFRFYWLLSLSKNSVKFSKVIFPSDLPANSSKPSNSSSVKFWFSNWLHLFKSSISK